MTDTGKQQTVWKTYPDYPFIEVNQFGVVRTKDRIVTYKNGVKHFYKGRVLKQWRDKGGYLNVHFRVNRKLINLKVHRIVATCFLPNPEHLEQVNHKDCNRANNNVDNLEWCSASYNSQYREKYGRAFGHPLYAVNLETLEVLRFESQAEAGRKLGIDSSSICKVLNGQLKMLSGYWFTEDKSQITKWKIQKIKFDIFSLNGVIAVNRETKKVSYFESQHEAARQLGISQGNINNVLKGRYRKTSGYWFCKVDKYAVEKIKTKFGDSVACEVEKMVGENYD